MFVMDFYEGGHVLTSVAAHFIPDAPERRAPPLPAGCLIQHCYFFMLEAAKFLLVFVCVCVFNLEAAQMCQREVTRQEVGAVECGCVGEVSLV